MCKGSKGCGCSAKMLPGSSFRVNEKEFRTEKLDGADYVVFPVIMAKSDVPMNGALFPEEEYFADAWNGVPVTIGHPANDDGSFLNANLPHVIEQMCVGRIFNAEVKFGNLIGEAWVDVEKLNRIDRELLEMMEFGAPLDVSTGFFASIEDKAGKSGGKEYSQIVRDVIPNHLALLPSEEGACSWKDGCGVRANKRGMMTTFKDVIARLNAAKKKTKKKNEDTPDKAALIEALMAFEGSPFGDEDKPALEAMSDKALLKVAEGCMPKQEPEANADEEVEDSEEEEMAEKKNAALSAEDKEALAFARRAYDEKKTELVNKIVANSDMKKEALEAMPVATLETIAAGLRVAPVGVDFSARALPETDDTKRIVEAMSGGVVAHIHAKKKGA